MRMLIFLTLVVVLGLGTCTWAEGDWNQLDPPNAPSARQGHSLVTMPDGQVVMFGGEGTHADLFNDLYVFQENDWTETAPANEPPPARSEHQAWLNGDKMYVYGGKGENGPLDDMWTYDTYLNQWDEVNAGGTKPPARQGHSADRLSDGSTIIFGGKDSGGFNLRDCWKYSGGSYEPLRDCPRAYSEHITSVVAEQYLLVFGEPGTIVIYDIANDSWTVTSGGLPLGGQAATAVAQNDLGEDIVFVFGGIDAEGNESDVVYEFNTATAELTQRQDPMPLPVANGAVAVLPDPPQAMSEGILDYSPMSASLKEELQVLYFGGVSDRVVTNATLAGTLAAATDITGTDPAHKYAWGENIGWANAAPPNQEVTVHYYEGTGGWLSGHAWGENIGWIVMGSAGGGPYANTTSNNWGANLAADGDLSGYAWGENVGWINFGAPECDAAIDPANGEFSGHAWGENIGWLKFKGASPDYGVRSMAFYTQAQGTPNWWLDAHGVTEGYDAGDGVVAWRKYMMDADPTVAGDYLRITAVSNDPAGTEVVFTPASTRRYYTLTRRDDLTEGGWSNVAGQVAVSYGTVGEKTMQDTNAAARAFYSVEVTVEP